MDKLYQPIPLPWQTGEQLNAGALQDYRAGAMLQGMASSAAAVLKEKLPGLIVSDTKRWMLRAVLLGMLAVTAWVVTQATPSEAVMRWYLAGMLNGMLLLPMVVLALVVEKISR